MQVLAIAEEQAWVWHILVTLHIPEAEEADTGVVDREHRLSASILLVVEEEPVVAQVLLLYQVRIRHHTHTMEEVGLFLGMRKSSRIYIHRYVIDIHCLFKMNMPANPCSNRATNHVLNILTEKTNWKIVFN